MLPQMLAASLNTMLRRMSRFGSTSGTRSSSMVAHNSEPFTISSRGSESATDSELLLLVSQHLKRVHSCRKVRRKNARDECNAYQDKGHAEECLYIDRANAVKHA